MTAENQETKLEFHQYFEMLPIPDTLKNHFKLADELASNYIKPLKKVNIFIGENNSGKSWLQRELLKQRLFRFFYNSDTFKELSKKIREDFVKFQNSNEQIIADNTSMPILTGQNDPNSPVNLSYLINRITLLNEEYFPNTTFDIIQYKIDLDLEIDEIKTNDKTKDIYNHPMNYHTHHQIMLKLIEYQNELKDLFDSLPIFQTQENTIESINKVYIPIIRTTSKSIINDADYIAHFAINYKIKNSSDNNLGQVSDISEINTFTLISENTYIHYGNTIFKDISKKLLTNSITRKDLADFEDFISKEFFQGQRFSITPGEYQDNGSEASSEDKNLIIKIGDHDDLKIHEIGTGIQMMIILTWPIFNYPNGMIFIEEPELYLHPRFQHQLMRIYATHERAKNFQFFINTHSNHIFDQVADKEHFSLFTVTKNSDNNFSICNFPFGDHHPLRLLGVRPSSIAVANCIIWVEGPSDRIYINKWIEIFNNHEEYKTELENKHINLIEGVHYQINFYGGSIISHYTCSEDNENSEATENLINIVKINPNAILVADSDFSEKRKELKINLKRIKEEIEKTHSSIWITSGKEIENYIPNSILETFDKKTAEESQSEKKPVSTFDIIKSKYIIDSKYNSKVQFAEYIASKMNYDNLHNHLDLKKQMEFVLDKIYLWNHIILKENKIISEIISE